MSHIKHDIKIDFPLSAVLKNTIKEAEELDAKGDFEYYYVADMIDLMCKEAYATGKITRKQWDLMVEKYPGFEAYSE